MKLREYLKEQKITAYSISRKTNISQSTISEFMSGKRVIKFDTACKLANALDITLDKLEELTIGGEYENF
ncbi:helix-turn-helix domain-containing protein [Clostridium tertium]